MLLKRSQEENYRQLLTLLIRIRSIGSNLTTYYALFYVIVRTKKILSGLKKNIA